jgi:DNA polymerase elongation subunit (family B)
MFMSFKWDAKSIKELIDLRQQGFKWDDLSPIFDLPANALRKAYYRYCDVKINAEPTAAPKVLILDIETLPMEAYVWGLFDQNIGLDMIKTDWSVLSFSAKWLGAPADQIMYYDTRAEKNVRDDFNVLKKIHSLLDECDVTITQNGIRFDIPKLNARFIKHGMKPPSSFRNIDTLRIAKRHFNFTSNKLAYMTDMLCTKYKKLSHSDFSGFKLWDECMKRNPLAFASMEKYNKYDVLSLEELYLKLAPWDKTIRFSVFSEDTEERCSCGSLDLKPNGFIYTNTAKHQRFTCGECGKEYKDSTNLLSKKAKNKLK